MGYVTFWLQKYLVFCLCDVHNTEILFVYRFVHEGDGNKRTQMISNSTVSSSTPTVLRGSFLFSEERPAKRQKILELQKEGDRTGHDVR